MITHHRGEDLDPKELLERNMIQVKFLEDYQDWFKDRYGHEPHTSTELLLELVGVGLAEYFAFIFELSREEINEWVTGEELEHSPSMEECFQHLDRYYHGLEERRNLESD